MPLETGQLLRNRYTITEGLTHGGMGSIYRAHDESLNYEVAVKENLFSTEEYSRQFRREATILANLRHPNLPRVTDHFVIEGQGQYLVMDYIEGDDLRQLMSRQGSIPEDEVVSIGVAICDALSYLHSRKPSVVHRDIKPGNIKVTPTDQAFLVDFGLAKITEAGQSTTIGAQALTPGYAPPEQYGQGTDSRSDIYSLGSTLYAALTGKIPEDGLARAMGSAELTQIRKHNPLITDRTAVVIEKAMSVKPEDRYQTAEDFKLALLNSNTQARRKIHGEETRPGSQVINAPSPENDIASSPTRLSQAIDASQLTQARPPTFTLQPVEKTRKTNWGVMLVGGLILVGIFAAVVYFGINGLAHGGGLALVQPTQTQVAMPPATLVDTPTRLSTQPSATATAVLQPSATVVISATVPVIANPPASVTPFIQPSATLLATPLGGGGGEIVFVTIRENNKPQLWLMASDGSNARGITNYPDGACQPDWSPDGKRLVFVRPCARKSDEYPGASLFIMNVDGSGLSSISTTPQGDFDPAWSPDGNMIAFTSLRDRSPHIYIYNFQDGLAKRISSITVTDRQPAWSPDSKQLVFVSTRGGANQIWTMAVDGTSPKEFSLLEWGPAFKPAWSPDGPVILYNQSPDLPRLMGVRIEDRFTQFEVAKNLRPVADVAYSHDGLWLAFEGVQDNQNHDIFVMDRNGTRVTRLTTDLGFDFQPAWRP